MTTIKSAGDEHFPGKDQGGKPPQLYKEAWPTGSLLEPLILKERLSALEKRLAASDPRTCRKGQMSKAEWDPESGKVLVTLQRGKHWRVMGLRDPDNNQQMVLRPEEALFLLESGRLELTFKGNEPVVPMSVQQGYEALIGGPLLNDNNNSFEGISLEEYLTYSYLTRLGYRLRRHHRRPLPPQSQAKCSSKRPAPDGLSSGQPCNGDHHQISKKPRVLKETIPSMSDVPDKVSDNSSNEDKDYLEVVEPKEELSRSEALEAVPNCYMKKRISLVTPPADLLPQNCQPQQKVYILYFRPRQSTGTDDDGFQAKEAEVVVGSKPSSSTGYKGNEDVVDSNAEGCQQAVVSGERSSRGFYPALDFPVPTSATFKLRRRNGSCRFTNRQWHQLKMEERRRRRSLRRQASSGKRAGTAGGRDQAGQDEALSLLQDGPVRKLWSGATTVPLIRPSDAVSVENVLALLTLSCSPKPSEEFQAQQQLSSHVSKDKGRFSISFDIYTSKVNFRKGKDDSVPAPNYRVVVVNPAEAPWLQVPTSTDIYELVGSHLFADRVPLLFSVVAPGSPPSFYSFSPVNLPNMPNP